MPRKEESESKAPSKSTCTCPSIQPWLISQHATLFSAFIPTIKKKFIVELRGKTVVASYYGWLVVADTKDLASISLFNPFSLATIDVPRLDLLHEELADKEATVNFVMTSAPDIDIIDGGHDRCVLVVTWKSIIMFCRPWYDTVWQIHPARVNVEGVSRELRIHSISTSCNGVIYGLLLYDKEMHLVKLVIYNQQDDTDDDGSSDDYMAMIRLEHIGQFNKSHSYSRSPKAQPYLVESCGELYFVILYHDRDRCDTIEKVRVLKFVQKDENADVKVVESLENRALFVGYNCSFSCYAPTKPSSTSVSLKSEGSLLKGNCVYITSWQGVNFVYQLENRTLVRAPLIPKYMLGYWVTSATKKRNVDEGCNFKAKSYEEIKTQTAICSFDDQTQVGELLLELPMEMIALVAIVGII